MHVYVWRICCLYMVMNCLAFFYCTCHFVKLLNVIILPIRVPLIQYITCSDIDLITLHKIYFESKLNLGFVNNTSRIFRYHLKINMKLRSSTRSSLDNMHNMKDCPIRSIQVLTDRILLVRVWFWSRIHLQMLDVNSPLACLFQLRSIYV